jgi:hypothetical protein
VIDFHEVCIYSSQSDVDSDTAVEQHTLHYYKAVECTGRQDDSDVYVFGPTLQFDNKGARISADQQQYQWIPHIISKLGTVVNPLPDLPDVQHPLTTLLKGLQSVAGDNAISGITLLSEYIIKKFNVHFNLKV